MREPRNFSSVILKLTAFCNLNCSYCYMFNLADATHARVPRTMPSEVAVLALSRLASHVRAHGGNRIKVILHGGEPTLWPLDNFRRFFEHVEAIRASGIIVDGSLQTNAIHLPRALIHMLAAHDVTIGVSLDGPQPANDRFRVTHTGSGSYDAVMESLRHLLDGGFDPRKVGILSVVNPSLPPGHFLEWAAGLPVRQFSVLWPIHYSWANPPWQLSSRTDYERSPLFGQWMASAFALWWERYVPGLYVRQFVDTIARIMGSRHHSDSIGNDFVDMLVVNTDGGIEYPDYLRAHQDGGSRTEYSLAATEFDELTHDKIFQILLRLRDYLPGECHSCRERDVCGGGFLGGRAGAAGFDQSRRSVLCYDQFFYFQAARRLIAPYLEILSGDSQHRSADFGVHE